MQLKQHLSETESRAKNLANENRKLEETLDDKLKELD
jgi:hypothetical protein